MRRLILVFLLVCLSSFAFSQKTIYLDKQYKKTSIVKATYKGVMTRNEKGFMMEVYGYYSKQLVSVGHYSKGKSPSTKNRIGTLTYYHSNGKVSSEGEVLGEKYIGAWNWYYSNGNKRVVCRYDSLGNLDGSYRHYYRGNVLYKEYYCVNDTIDGESITYFPNGKISTHYYYRTGKVYDTGRTYHLNGNLSSLVVYQKGKKNGSAMFYHSNGQVAADEWYEDGKLVRFHFYNETGTDVTSDIDTASLDTLPQINAECHKDFVNHLFYPSEARENNISGRLLITFFIDENNELFSHQVFLSEEKGYGLEEAALQAAKKHLCIDGPVLIHNRKTVIQFTLPVTFNLK